MASALTYEQIAWNQLSTTASSVTFSSIAASWTDLRLVVAATMTTAATGFNAIVNSDASTNYSMRGLYGNGSTTASGNNQNYTIIQPMLATNGSTTIPTIVTFDFMQYANTGVYKTILTSTAGDKNGSGSTEVDITVWRNTAAINQITVNTSSSTFASGSTFALYGIKAA